MMKPKTYLQALKKTFTVPSYYLILMNTKKKFSLRFFLTSFFILGILLAVKITTIDIPRVKKSIMLDQELIIRYFPNDIFFEWKNNKLEAFQQRADESPKEYTKPITLDYPRLFSDEIDNLPLIFLTYISVDENIEQISTDITSPSLIVVTKNSVYIKDLNSKKVELETDDGLNKENWNQTDLTAILAENKSWQISKKNITSQIESFNKEIDANLRIVNVIVFIVTPILLTISRLFFLINLIFVYIIIKLNRISINYKQLLKISLHILVISETINQISNILYPNLKWSFFSLTFYLVTAFILFYLSYIKKMIFCLVKKKKKN